MCIRIVAILAMSAVVLQGCGSPQDSDTPAVSSISIPISNDSGQTLDGLMQEWKELAKSDFGGLNTNRAMELVQRMAAMGPDGLTALLDVLEDKDANPVAKVLVVISMTPFIQQEQGGRLLAMTQPDRETTTRTCATHLLGFIKSDEAGIRLRELSRDPERRVRVEALLVLVMQGDVNAIAQARDLWEAPDTTDRERTQLLLMIPEAITPQFIDLYAEALSHGGLERGALNRAVTVLGRSGDASVLEALEAFAALDGIGLELHALAKSAAAAVEARIAQPDSPAPSDAATAPEPAAAP